MKNLTILVYLVFYAQFAFAQLSLNAAALANPQGATIGASLVADAPKFLWEISAAGGTDGMVEGFEFDGRTSWERKRGVAPYGPRGSQSWRMIYNEGDPAKGVKSRWHDLVGAWDWYHKADDRRKAGYIVGGITVGIGGVKTNNKLWHYAADLGISLAISGFAKSRGMNWIRG